MTAVHQSRRTEIGLAPQLGNAKGDLIGVSLFLRGMLREFLRGIRRINPLGHKKMTLVTEHAHNFGGERFVEDFNDDAAVGLITAGNSASLYMLTGPFADFLQVVDKIAFRHDRLLFYF